MFKSFGEFIIAVYGQDRDASRYLATECLKKKAGDASLVRKMWNPIVVWKEAFTVTNFWDYTASPQGSVYWERLGKDVRDVFYNEKKIREEEEDVEDFEEIAFLNPQQFLFRLQPKLAVKGED